MDFRPNDTQVYKRVARVRSRHMIPMEMLAFLTLGVAGFSGAFGPGYLHDVLSSNELSLEWGFAILPLAMLGVLVAAAEWWIGHDWQNGALRHSITIRMWNSALAAFLWFYVLYVMVSLRGEPVTSMVITACFVSPFHIWSWWVNYRVHCALDPAMKTERLGARLETNRDRW